MAAWFTGYQDVGVLDNFIIRRMHVRCHARHGMRCFTDVAESATIMIVEPGSEKATVLIVEDEMILRMRAVDIVEDAGFISLEAVNADDALALLETNPKIELLFTDIQMPGSMNGLKLAHAVHERWPSIKIILVSGQITPSEDERPANSRFFGKPVAEQQMIAELQAMIGQGTLELIPPNAATSESIPKVRPLVQSDEADTTTSRQVLTAENDSLRLLLEQAGIDAETLLAQAGIDAKEREAADKLQKLILEEMHHRIKNTLATVRAITTQSLRTAISIASGQLAIEGRLDALGHAHDLLLQARWANASFAQIIRSATEPYDSKGSGKFSIEGPDLSITSGAVIAFALTLNELCTNTTKFGALSVPGGRVAIQWSIDPEKSRLKFTWTESGGPAVTAPSRKSFGTRLIGSLGQQLLGEVQLDYGVTGFTYALDVPMASLVPAAVTPAL